MSAVERMDDAFRPEPDPHNDWGIPVFPDNIVGRLHQAEGRLSDVLALVTVHEGKEGRVPCSQLRHVLGVPRG